MTRSTDTAGPIARLRLDRPEHFRRRYLLEGWLVAMGIVAVVVCMLLARDGTVSAAERRVFEAINGLPDGLKIPMWIIQIFGSLAFVVAVAVAALLLRRYRLGTAILVAIPVKLMVEWWVIKALVERERPAFTVADAIVRDSNTNPLGFPSGHAILAFALAGLLAPYLGRRGAIVVYLVAVANAVARVYLGAHNPLDVVAGAAAGIAVAAALNAALGVPQAVE